MTGFRVVEDALLPQGMVKLIAGTVYCGPGGLDRLRTAMDNENDLIEIFGQRMTLQEDADGEYVIPQ